MFTALFLVFAVVSLYGKDRIGSISFGYDYLPENRYRETRGGVYELNRSGIHLGFSFPLNFPRLDYSYRVAVTSHDIANRSWGWRSVYNYSEIHLYDYHFSALNELLIGKEFRFSDFFTILPQLGTGIQCDALSQNDGSNFGGFVYGSIFLDFSNEFRFEKNSWGTGVRVNYILSVYETTDVYEATDRLQISFLIFR